MKSLVFALLLFLLPALARALPDYYPQMPPIPMGKLAEVGANGEWIIVNDMKYALAKGVRIRTPETSKGTLSDLAADSVVGLVLEPGQSTPVIQEIFVYPSGSLPASGAPPSM